ncbi:MAG: hypothetical protein K2X53_06235 [Alphaproteobacteria bacterium]|nr:hypothetical protein [Alphaproteobacteria bacterium]
MKKSIKFLLLTIFLSTTPAQAKFCVNVNSDKNFFDQKGNLSSAIFVLEFDQSGHTQELEVKVSQNKPSNTICTPEQEIKSRKFFKKKPDVSDASMISNVRATLTVTDKNGKSEGVQCGIRMPSVDREYLTGKFDLEQVNATISREDLHAYQMKSQGRKRASKETCLFKIVEKSKKK